MTLPASGSISLSQVNTELGYSSSAQISLNDSAVRTLFGKSSGTISMSDGYGKANAFAFTISSNQTNANLATLATSAGWNQSSALVATISSGVYISSNSTGTPALTVSGSFPGGVSLTNNGYIVGMGGNAGSGGTTNLYWCGDECCGSASAGVAGSAGGLALSVSSAITITNNGTIGGGGGGGGGGGAGVAGVVRDAATGGGGGGGRSSNAANSSGGAAGSGGGNCSAGNTSYGAAGNQGTVSAAGTGGGGGYYSVYAYGGAGGTGGAWGAAGSTGSSGKHTGGGSGGAAGGAVSGNSNITWASTGTRLGGIT